MAIQHASPEHIRVTTPETALRVTQSGTGNAFVVEDTRNDSTSFVIDSDGKVGVGKTPVYKFDIEGNLSVNNVRVGYTTTATSSGTTTLTADSTRLQFFTGSQAHTVVLPVVSTLSRGHQYEIHNNSTGALTVNSSGGNLLIVVPPRTTVTVTSILTTGTNAASWDADFTEVSSYATTATAGATTTLTVSSAQRQFFTGTQSQTVVLPAVNTLNLGQFYIIHNNSLGALTINSSGGNLVYTLPGRQTATLTAIATTGTDASVWDIDTYKSTAYETTVTSGGSTTLNVSSPTSQFFTGSSNHTVILPVASTLTVGDNWTIHNDATGNLIVQTSGGNTLITLSSGTTITVTCILASGTGTSSWSYDFDGFNNATGSGAVVRQASPSFTTTTGSAPFTVASTTKVTNLNADLLDGNDSTYFLDTSSTAQTKLGDLTIEGNLDVQGTISYENVTNNQINNNFLYLNEPSEKEITNAVGNGTTVTYTTALDHGWVSGTVVRITDVVPSQYNTGSTYYTIDSVTTNTFTITFNATGTYTSGGAAFNKASTNPDLGWSGGYNDGTYHHAGVFRDATDGVFKIFKGYDPEPSGAFIDTSDPSFELAPLAISEIVGTSETAYALNVTQTLNTGGLKVTNTGTGNSFLVEDSASTDTTPFVIDASGYVGVGTTTYNGYKLRIIGNATQTIQMSSSDTNNADKYTLITQSQYASTAEPEGFTLIGGGTGVSANTVYIGGFYGESNAANYIRLYTTANTTTRAGTERFTIDQTGRVGINKTSGLTYQLEVNGSFAATTKSFDIEHPTKEGQRLQHGSLEGPELGVYVRGRGKVGEPIALPDYWTGLVDEGSITVQLTAIGGPHIMYVSEISANTVAVGSDVPDGEFFYLVLAERKDVEKLVVEY